MLLVYETKTLPVGIKIIISTYVITGWKPVSRSSRTAPVVVIRMVAKEHV